MRTVLVVGATGHQGAAVAEQMLAAGWRVRALTRNPGQPKAVVLSSRGVEVVRGDLDEPASIDRALVG